MEIEQRRMRCAIYARTAVMPAVNAARWDTKNSIESQVALCMRYLDALSGVLVAQYTDAGVRLLFAAPPVYGGKNDGR